jgi:acetylornithine deacetylase
LNNLIFIIIISRIISRYTSNIIFAMKTTWLKITALLTGSVVSATSYNHHPVGNSAAAIQSSLLSLHKSLVEHPSVTGSELNVALFLQTYLENIGFTVELQPVENHRHNVLAYFGDSRETRVLVTSHIDTVPPFFPYERRGDEIWGRGSVDAKGSVAAQITAINLLHQDRRIQEGDVALLFVVGEERGGAGMKAVNALALSWEAVIFGEPTELKLARGHKGGLGFNVTARGKAGHSGYPELGRNAIDILVQGLAKLQSIELPGSKEFGATTLNVGTIRGGVAANVIAQDAFATVSVRLAVDNSTRIRQIIEQVVLEASPWLEVDFSSYAIGPVQIDHDIEGSDSNTFLRK